MNDMQRFGSLLDKEGLTYTVRSATGATIYTINYNGKDVMVEFDDTGIHGIIETQSLFHRWEIFPTDFRQAIRKVREVAC